MIVYQHQHKHNLGREECEFEDYEVLSHSGVAARISCRGGVPAFLFGLVRGPWKIAETSEMLPRVPEGAGSTELR